MTKPRILLVDDEEEFVTTLVERLQWRGYHAVAAMDAAAAFACLDRETFDVAVVDLKMPGIDGVELRRRMRERYPEMSVWLATGHGHDPVSQEGVDEFGQEILLKPFSIDALLATIGGDGTKERKE